MPRLARRRAGLDRRDGGGNRLPDLPGPAADWRGKRTLRRQAGAGVAATNSARGWKTSTGAAEQRNSHGTTESNSIRHPTNSPPFQGGARGASRGSVSNSALLADKIATPISRRNLFKIAGLAAASWLTPVAETLAHRAERASGREPAQSVILLWLAGGPSQLETFDPQPGTDIAGGTTAISTAIQGIQLAAGSIDWPNRCRTYRWCGRS